MKKLYISLLLTISLFLFACRTGQAVEPQVAPAIVGGEETEPPEGDMEHLFRQAEEAQNQQEAVDLYCEAARRGHPLSQFRLGQVFAEDVEHGLLETKEGQRQPEDQPETPARRNLAAAMMWLDMAIINKVPEARDLRARLGLLAKPADFRLYADYTRMEVDAPCAWAEVYGGQPPSVTRGPAVAGQPPADEYYDVQDGENVE